MQRVGITLCRGRNCGTARRHPEIDHAVQRERLEDLASAGHAALRVSTCLGQCRQGNVVVVRPVLSARIRGERAVWIGPLDDALLPQLEDWVRAGGPGRAPLPDALSSRIITPTAVCT
jgi:(2Fe-2S) ferredoxin